MSDKHPAHTQHGWELVDDGEDSEVRKVRCPECGEVTTVIAPMALAKDIVECSNCGNTKKLNAPSPIWALLIVAFAFVYAFLLHVKNRVIGLVR